ncbi:MAG TPA: flagellar basal body L-ring protein FlgH [Verrucomicrobiae bacterium]|nr:flagellar basal body L-ring protein FlgH [Verrucomicrobiae bacterium]
MKLRSLFLCEVLAAWVLAGGSAGADSLWHGPAAPSMFADPKAFAVGDIVTILVQESSTATKNNETKTSKKASVDAALETFLYSPAGSGLLTHHGQMPAMKFDASHSFDGGGTINNNEQIVAKVAARVVDVLPNKNLVVEGTRHTSFAGEQQDIVLRGVVRPQDIAANNTVYSYCVADATVKIVNKGTVTDTQRKGWFTKAWDWITPF